ncbi:MAG: methyl-accepting chemotaxis protein [Solirubrobacteraceae bacterium]
MHSLRTKLILSLVPLVVVVVGAMTWLAVSKMTSAQERTSYAEMRATAAQNANAFDAQLERQVELTQTIADFMGAYRSNDRREISAALKTMAENNPRSAGTYVAYTAGRFDGPTPFAPYWNRLGGKLTYSTVDELEGSAWFDTPLETGKPFITEPFVYEGVLMSSFVAPILRGGRPVGVAGNDATATSLQQATAKIKVLDSGYAMLVSNQGMFIAAPDKKLAGKKTLTQLGREKDVAQLAEVADAVRAGRNGQIEAKDPFTGKDVVMSYAPLDAGGWSLIAVAPKSEVLAEAHTLRWQLLLAGLIGILLIAAAIIVIAGRITGPMKAFVTRLRSLNDTAVAGLHDGIGALARGDLTVEAHSEVEPLPVRGHDEIADASQTANALIEQTSASVEAYNAARGALGELIGQVTASAGAVSAASAQMATTSEEAGRAVSEIAGAVGEVAAGAERQVRMVETARTAAEQTSEAAAQALAIADEGASASEQATAAMAQVRGSSASVSDAIRALSSKSDEIGGIVETITGIAAQTNLLALNAAIEAARAGEQGRGFAVVAEEVRKLAEESQQAAGTIAGLIEEIQSETKTAVGIVEDGAERSEHGAEVVEQARAAFERIGDAVRDVSARIGEIATATSEVAAVAEQSSASSEQVSASTQETSASTQEIAATAQELARTAEELEAQVQRFTLA